MAEQGTIAELNLDIKSSGDSAASGINAVVSALKGLKGEGDIGGIQVQLKGIANAFSSITKLSQQVSSATVKVPKVKVPKAVAPVGTNQTAQALGNAQAKAAQHAQQMNRVAGATRNAETNTLKLSDVTNKLRAGFSRVMSVGRRVVSVLTNIAASAGRTAKQLVAVFRSGDNSNGLLRNLQRLRVNIYNVWYITQVLGRAFGALFDKASESYEILHLFKAAYSDNSEAGNEAAQAAFNFYDNLAKVAGLDTAPMARTAATFKEMANAMGMGSDASDKISQGLTQLTYDYASLFDYDFDVVAGKFQSALAGQTRAIRTFGLDVTQAALQQELLNEGINASVTDLNRAQKSILIYNTIMRNSKNAQQDFAASVMQPANLLRVLREQVSLAARSFGALFIPAISAVLPYLIALAHALGQVFGRIAQFFGIKLPDISSVAAGGLDGDMFDDVEEGLDNVESGAGGATDALKKMKDYVTGLDELNILRPDDADTGAGGGGAGGGAGGGDYGITPVDPYDFLGDFSPLQTILDSLGDGVKKIGEAWGHVGQAAARGFKVIRASYRQLIEESVIARFKATFIEAIVSVINLLAYLIEGFAKAWTTGNRGTKILRNVFLAMTGILDVVRLIADTIGKWFLSSTGQYWIGAILDGFGAINAAIVTVTDQFKAMWADGGRVTFEEKILPALASIITMFEAMYEKVILIVGGFVTWGFESKFFSTLSDILSNITGFMTDIVTEIERWFNGPDGEPFKENLQGIADAALRFVDAIRNWWNNGGAELVEMFATDIAGFAAAFGNFVARLVEMGALSAVVTIADVLVKFLTFLVDNDVALALVAGTLAGLAGAIKLISFGVTNFAGIKTLMDTVGKIGGSMSFTGIADGIVGGLGSALGIALGAVAAIVGVIRWFQRSWDFLVDSFERFINDIDLEGVFDEIGVAVGELWKTLNGDDEHEGVLSTLGELFEIIADVLANVVAPQLSICFELMKLVLGVISALAPPAIKFFTGLVKIVGGLADVLLGIASLDGDRIFKGFKGMFEGNVDLGSSVGDAVGGLAKNNAVWFGNVLDDITGLFGHDTNFGAQLAALFNEPVKVIQMVWGGISRWFNDHVIQPVISFFRHLWDNLSSLARTAVSGVEDAWNTVGKWFDDNVATPISTVFDTLWNALSTWASETWRKIEGVWIPVSRWFDQTVIRPVREFFAGLGESIGGVFSGVWNGIKGVWNTAAAWFNNNVVLPISRFFNIMWDGLASAASAAFGGIVSVVRGPINSIISFVNSVLRGVNGLLGKARTMPGVGGMIPGEFGYIPYLARGGVVDGGLFHAGEAGPELLGSFRGNKNTVMPLENSGFVEAVAGAVFAAVVDAMAQSDGDGGQGDVFLDVDKVGVVMRKRERVSGRDGGLVPVGV